jgi:predicted amidohydrolase
MLAAVVQLTSTSDAEASMATAEALVRRAAGYGARFVATPECTNYLGPHKEKVQLAETLDGPTCQRFAALADELDITLLLGSFNERVEGETTRCANTSVLFGPDGRRLAHYRKLHLFDVDVPGMRFHESNTCVPGDDVVVASAPFGTLGLSICYDLRFPELYRSHVDRGATVLAVPSAFTATTGKAHWEPLLRARAIETQCYVLAPGQVGHHDDGGLRNSHGHSMIVDPWGAVVAQCSDGPGLALAELDLDRVQQIRRHMPVQQHRRV